MLIKIIHNDEITSDFYVYFPAFPNFLKFIVLNNQNKSLKL